MTDSFEQSNQSTNIDTKPSSDDLLPLEKNKTTELNKSGLMGLKKKPMLTNRYLVVWINSHESDSPVEMKLELPNQCTVQDCVALSLKSINDLISKENKDYTLSEDPSNYLFYISKKNGMPKTDYPPFDMDQKLNETSILTYTLVNKSEAAYNFKSESKPKICELSQSTDTNGMSFVSTFGKSLKDKNDEVLSNKNVKTSIDRQNHTNDKCECWCFPWLLKKKSKEILLENNNTSSDTDDNIVKNSAI